MSHGISPASRSRSAAAAAGAPASASSAAAAKAKLNGTGLSAGALLAASAQASTDLARMLSKHDRSRSRSRSRTRSPGARNPAAAAAGLMAGLGSTGSAGAGPEEDPFLVHTAGSAATSIHSHSHHSHSRHRSKSPHAAVARRSSKHRSAATAAGSSSKHRSSRDRADRDRAERDVPASSAASSVSQSSVDRDRERDRTRVSRSSKHRHRSQSRDRAHRSRSRSRSASRPRMHSGLIEPSVRVVDIDSSGQPRHGSSSSHHARRHASSSSSGFQATQHRSSSTRSRSRTRSRSHSRNRYPDGLAPHMQTTQGSLDHEQRSRYGAQMDGGFGGSRGSPPMSPSRLDARFQFEQARREREDAELRLIMAEQQRRLESEHARQREMRATGVDPYGADGIEGTGDSPRYRQTGSYDRGYDDEHDAHRFDLEEEDQDPVKHETHRLPGGFGGPRGGVLTCPLCECRFEEPAKGAALAGSGSKVPRYLLCGHTYCTGCLSQLVQAQEELSAVVASSAPLVSLSLPCPHVGGGAACGPTPVSLEHGAMSLPVNRSYLDVSAFLRSRRAAGLGLKDSGVGRGDERGEDEKIAELNAEISADAEHSLRTSMGAALPTALPCQQCQVHIAALYCQSCNVRFCAGCSAAVHVGRALAEHVKRGLVVTINVARARGLLFQSSGAGGASAGGQPINPALMCPTHSDQPLSLYCRTCQVPVCRDCVTPLFRGRHLQPAHDVDLLSTVLASTLTELRGGVSSLEGVVSRLEGSISAAGAAVSQVGGRISDVRAELREAFELVRAATLKALADRERLLDTELLRKGAEKEARIQAHRAQLAKVLIGAKAAQEEGVRILGSTDANAAAHSSATAEADIFSIKALLDVRAAITAGSLSASAPPSGSGLDATALAQQGDVLLRLKPRDLIRHLESQISRQGGLIAAVPSAPAFLSFAAQGTAMVVSWAPGAPPGEGEVLEYTLHVCELPREWRSKLRALNPSLFPNPPDPAFPEDAEADAKWNGDGTLGSRSRQAVNWVSVAPGAVALGGAAGEMNWALGGAGAEFAGPYTTLYSGEVTSVKHDNLSVTSAYIYRLTVKNDLGASAPVYSMPCTLPCMRLSYASDMDSNGLVTFLGSAGGSAPWSNPALQNLLEVSASSVQIGEPSALVSRAASTLQTLNRHLSWVKIDLGRGQPFRLQLSHYTLAHCGRGVGVRRALRNWALQGSLNGVDWVTLREHVNDQTLAPIPLATGTWSVTQPAPAAYRFVRILQTDVNQANDHHLALGQIELYGWLVRD